MLDLDNYRERLTVARRELAYSRMVCYFKGLRKRKRTEDGRNDSDEDFEYQDEED